MNKYINLIILFMACYLPAKSQQADSLIMTGDSLSHYLEEGGNNNPQIKSNFAAYQASLQISSQSGTLPDPSLEIGFFLEPMALVNGNQRAQFKLMQMFPWFGSLTSAKQMSDHKAKQAYEQYREGRDNLYLQIQSQWFLLCDMGQKLKNYQENRKLLDQLESLAENKVKTGSGNLSSVLRIQLQEAELDNSIEKMKANIQAGKIKFNTLLNRPLESDLRLDSIIEISNYDIEALNTDQLNNNPSLNSIEQASLAYESKIKMDKRMSYPMLGIGLEYMLIDKTNMGTAMANMNGKDMIMPMISLNIPLYRNKYNAQEKQNTYMQQASEDLYQNKANELKAQFYQLKADLENSRNDISLYKKQEALAQTTYDLIVQEFASGKTELNTVIEVQSQLLNYQLKQADAITNYNTKIAQLQKLISK